MNKDPEVRINLGMAARVATITVREAKTGLLTIPHEVKVDVPFRHLKATVATIMQLEAQAEAQALGKLPSPGDGEGGPGPDAVPSIPH